MPAVSAVSFVKLFVCRCTDTSTAVDELHP